MIKILHLSYCDRHTGAGIAAKRIHNCIYDYDDPEIKSYLRLNIDGINNRNIIYTQKLIPNFYNLFKKYFEKSCKFDQIRRQ